MKKTLATVAAGIITVTAVSACSTATSAPTSSSATAATSGADLAAFGLSNKSVREVIDTLDRTNQDRANGPAGSVQQDRLILTTRGSQSTMPLPADQTYISIAPYISQTHECFNHNLATCQGEQVDKTFTVTITDSNGKELVKSAEKTYPNGFIGFWLPRDIRGTITITGEGRAGSINFGTSAGDPTCLTTLQLT